MSVIKITSLELRQMFEAWKGWTLSDDVIEIEGFIKAHAPGHVKQKTKNSVPPRKVITDKEGFVLSDEPLADCTPMSGEYYELVFKKAKEAALKNEQVTKEIKVNKHKKTFISHEEYISNIKDVINDGGSKTVCIEEGVNKETFRQRYISAAKKIGCQNDIKFSIKGNTITIMKTEKEVLQ